MWETQGVRDGITVLPCLVQGGMWQPARVARRRTELPPDSTILRSVSLGVWHMDFGPVTQPAAQQPPGREASGQSRPPMTAASQDLAHRHAIFRSLSCALLSLLIFYLRATVYELDTCTPKSGTLGGKWERSFPWAHILQRTIGFISPRPPLELPGCRTPPHGGHLPATCVIRRSRAWSHIQLISPDSVLLRGTLWCWAGGSLNQDFPASSGQSPPGLRPPSQTSSLATIPGLEAPARWFGVESTWILNTLHLPPPFLLAGFEITRVILNAPRRTQMPCHQGKLVSLSGFSRNCPQIETSLADTWNLTILSHRQACGQASSYMWDILHRGLAFKVQGVIWTSWHQS